MAAKDSSLLRLEQDRPDYAFVLATDSSICRQPGTLCGCQIHPTAAEGMKRAGSGRYLLVHHQNKYMQEHNGDSLAEASQHLAHLRSSVSRPVHLQVVVVMEPELPPEKMFISERHATLEAPRTRERRYIFDHAFDHDCTSAAVYRQTVQVRLCHLLLCHCSSQHTALLKA